MSADGKTPEQIPKERIVPTLTTAFDSFLGPVAPRVRSVDELRFHVDDALVELPLDLLYLDGRPLFLSKQISFVLGHEAIGALPATNPMWRGLIISDPTTDPQRGLATIANLFQRSRFFSIEHFGLSDLLKNPPVDFVAVSGHGSIDATRSGYISLASGAILRPQSLLRLRSKLVYFDSCNLGLGVEFVSALADSGARYVLGPILSNEAGNSSTSTVVIFFAHIARGMSPVRALHLTRAKLFKLYRDEDVRITLWRSYPFRLYLAN